MTKILLRISSIVLFASLAVASRAFASTHDDRAFFKNAADQIGETSEMRLPLFSDTATASMCDTTAAAESAENVDPFPGAYIMRPDEPDAAALNWLENEMQMSFDPSCESQGIIPDFTCMDPPHNCPANVKCPDLAGGALCVVTSCGKGECPTCPKLFPGIITAWCAYGCMKGSKVVGGAYGFWVRFLGWRGPVCFSA